jgi:hypothetical protein
VEEIIMSLLGDVLKTAGDAMRLSSDVMRYKLEVKTKAVKRGVSHLALCAVLGLVALAFVGAGIGLLIYGAFAMVAHALGPGPSGLIIGAASILFAGLVMLVACGATRRS